MLSSKRGTPIAASISPRNWNFRFISPLVAGNTEGSSHRLVRRELRQFPGVVGAEGTVPVPLLQQRLVVGGEDAPVGLDHPQQYPGAVGEGDGLHRPAGACLVALVQADGLPELFQGVQVGAALDGLEGVIFQEHPVPHRVHDLLLGLEVVVHRPLGQAPQTVHDVLDGGILVPLFQEELLGHV